MSKEENEAVKAQLTGMATDVNNLVLEVQQAMDTHEEGHREFQSNIMARNAGLTAQLATAQETERNLTTALAQADAGRLEAETDKARWETEAERLKREYDAHMAQFHATPPPEPKVVEFVDFAQQGSGLFLGNKSLVGEGPSKSIFRMKPMSSTKKAIVDALVAQQSIAFRIMQAGGNSASQLYSGIEVGNLTLDGESNQGHAYGGFRLSYSKGAHLHDMDILAVPGFAPGPPGETFGLATFHSDGALLERIKIDGRTKAGQAVMATGLGYNFNTGRTVAEDVASIYSRYGFAVALWRCTGEQVFNNCDFRFGRRAINIEQTVGGSYEFNGCNFKDLTDGKWQAQISCIDASAKVVFRDPIVNQYPLRVRTYSTAANGGKNVQKDSDISCFIGDKDVTADPSKFLIVHTDS